MKFFLSTFQKIREAAGVLFSDDDRPWKDESQLTPLEKFVHFWILVWKSFVRNRGPIRASALAYTTLLALVPLLAIVVIVSTSLLRDNGSEPIKKMIDVTVAKVAPQLDLVSKDGNEGGGTQEVARKITEMIGNIRTGTFSATAIVALMFVAISLLTTIEATFNDIWGVTSGRNWFRRVVQYWTLITLGPILLAVALGLTTGPYLRITQEFLSLAPFFGSLIFALVPILVLALTFALFYKVIPNTAVHWRAAIVGGLVAAFLWQLNSGLNMIYVSQVVRNSKIYGSLGILPVFLLGVYLSWLILLFGGQVAYAFQNRRAYVQERQAESISQRNREFVALRLMTSIADRFERGGRPHSILELAEQIGIPSRLVAKILETLAQNKLLIEVSGAECGYVPGRPLEKISYYDIIDALRSGLAEELSTKEDAFRGEVQTGFQKMQLAESDVGSHITLDQLVREHRPSPVRSLSAEMQRHNDAKAG